MLFNSFEFLIFLPVTFLLYWFVFKSRHTQNTFIVVASYTFYGWWDWRFLLLIATTTLCSYFSGILLERQKEKRNIQKLISASNITLNLAIVTKGEAAADYQKHINRCRYILNKYEYQLYDFSQDPHFDESHFADVIHLNEQGAILFTQLLCEQLHCKKKPEGAE